MAGLFFRILRAPKHEPRNSNARTLIVRETGSSFLFNVLNHSTFLGSGGRRLTGNQQLMLPVLLFVVLNGLFFPFDKLIGTHAGVIVHNVLVTVVQGHPRSILTLEFHETLLVKVLLTTAVSIPFHLKGGIERQLAEGVDIVFLKPKVLVVPFQNMHTQFAKLVQNIRGGEGGSWIFGYNEIA